MRWSESVVEPAIPPVLVLRLRGDPAIVVRRPGGNRQRITLEQSHCRRVHSFPWNSVEGKGEARRGIKDRRQRAGDRLGENTRALKQRRHSRRANPANGLPASLVIREEERSVADDWAAENPAKLITAEKRFAGTGCRCRSKQVSGIESLIAEKLESRTVKLICAGFRR